MKSFLTYLLLLSCTALHAQRYNVDLKRWDVRDGLSNRQVNGICKDSRGYIWLCTAGGLNCFDGRRFRVFTKDKDGLPFDYLTRAEEDAAGKLWITGSSYAPGADNNLFIFDPLTQKATSFREKTGSRDTSRFNFLRKLSGGDLLFGDSRARHFYRWSGSRLRKISYPVVVKQLIWGSAEKSFWVLDTAARFCEIGADGQLLRAHKASGKSLLYQPTVDEFEISRTGGDGGGRPGLVNHVQIREGRGEVVNLYNHFLGVSDRFARASKDALQRYATELQLTPTNTFHYILIENDSCVWFAYNFGFFRLKFNPNYFRRHLIRNLQNIAGDSYRNLVVDGGTLYGVNEFHGVKAVPVDAEDAQPPASSLFPENFVGYQTLTKSSNGRIFGIQFSRLYEWKAGWKFSALHPPQPTLVYWKLAEVARDSFLAGTSRGLIWLNPAARRLTTFSRYNEFDELKAVLVFDIVPDRRGQWWLCSYSGLYRYDAARGVVERFSSKDSGRHFLPSDKFHHLHHDRDGIYWLATEAGLIRWNRERGTHRLFTRSDGLSNNNIYAVYEDSLSRLWLPSYYGLMQFSKQDFRTKAYFVEDGLTANEFNRASHTRDAQGRLYFGGLNGVVSFQPESIPDASAATAAPLALTSCEQFSAASQGLVNKTAQTLREGRITLRPGDPFFNLEFALLSYDDPANTRYYWRLDGVDSGWNALREPSLRVSGLPYGEKTLRIRAQASDGTPARNELVFSIRVLKPFYLRIWFLVLAGIGLLLAVFLGYRWRVYRLKKENERLDVVVKEKTVALEETISALQLSSRQKDVLMKEIHHRVKNNLQVIGTLLQLQLSEVSDEAARRSLEESAARVSSIALVHYHLYQGADLTAVELAGFVRELATQLSQIYLGPGQRLDLETDIPETWLDIDTVLPLGLLLNELMINSFKHAYAERQSCPMHISLQRRTSDWLIQYRDYGPGLPAGYGADATGSLGMTIIESLARQLEGRFFYDAEDRYFGLCFMDSAMRKTVA